MKTITEETRRKISQTLTGRKRSEETKRKIKQALIGRKISEETKRKMSQAHTGCNPKLNWKYKKITDKYLDRYHYKYACYDLWVTRKGDVLRVREYDGNKYAAIITPKPNRDNYLQVGTINEYGKPVAIPVHTLVALAYIGPRPEGFDVDHKNFDRTDNRASNLRYLSRSENRKRHAKRKAI